MGNEWEDWNYFSNTKEAAHDDMIILRKKKKKKEEEVRGEDVWKTVASNNAN
jgi:hypothetical protein